MAATCEEEMVPGMRAVKHDHFSQAIRALASASRLPQCADPKCTAGPTRSCERARRSMVDSARVLRRAPICRQSWLTLALLLTSSALAGCTVQNSDAASGALPPRVVPLTTGNSALSFDGVHDYATTGTAEFPAGRDPQTISAWFESADIDGKHALITLRKDEDSGVELGLKDGLVGAWRVYGNRTLLSATTPITVGTWHHVAYSFDGTTTNQLYLDGAVADSSTDLPDDRTPTTSWLGTLDGTNDLFNGSIDDFRVFDVTRTAGQIASEFAGKFSSSEAGLVLDLTCNESGGSTVYDHSHVANDGQLGDGVEQNMPTRVVSGAPDDTN